MPRITHVAKAQQRYATVPVIDEATGKPKQTPVMRNGVQRTTKRDRPIFMTVTVADKSKPLPPYKCDSCGEDIKVGTPYKHMTPKSGPYGGRKRTRHESCPTWREWEYSNSLSARLAQIAHDFDREIDSATSTDDVTSALENAASSVKEIADEKRDGASNIESGFGHSTEKSDELNDIAQQLDDWADQFESADIPELPDPEEEECESCGGTGKLLGEGEADCEDCEGTGQITPEEPTEDQIEDWRSEVRDSVTIVDESPV